MFCIHRFWCEICVLKYTTCQDLSKDFPIQISFSHVAGIKIISDYNGKLVPGQDPITLINSVEWRHGNQEFTDNNFPGVENIFLQFQNGKMTHYKQPVIVKCSCFGQLCSINSAAVLCQGCVTADARQLHVNNILVAKTMIKDTSLTYLLFHLPTHLRFNTSD